ncbi:MAG: TonB-dependent receptor domain-containing protein, partial [Pseudomonadota bacterium]
MYGFRSSAAGVRPSPRPPASALVCAVAVALGAPSTALGDPAPASGIGDVGQLSPVIVSADRIARTPLELTSTVTALDAAELEHRFVTDIRDLVRHEPGVVVRRAPARFGAAVGSTGREGNAGFNIRGLDGNRVLIQVDGIRVPAAFSFGPASFGRGAYLDVMGLRSVEILRGPASSLYGSDGIAGAVSLYTLDPADLLGESGVHASAAAIYSGEDDGVAYSARTAVRLGDDGGPAHELMAVVTRRTAEALDSFGSNEAPNSTRTAPNPQDFRSTAALAKWVIRPTADVHLRATVEHVRDRVESDVLSARAPVPTAPIGVLRLDARDETERTRAALDAEFDALGRAWADRASVAAYWQEAETLQFSAEDRNGAPDRTRDNRYGERVHGLNLQFDREFATGAVRHRLVYGADAARAFVSSLRDGTVPPPGESFPTKAFADTDYDLLGVFVQNELALGDTGVYVTPAVRWDRFELDPRDDARFPGTPVALSGDRASPKLAVRWRATENVSVYA